MTKKNAFWRFNSKVGFKGFKKASFFAAFCFLTMLLTSTNLFANLPYVNKKTANLFLVEVNDQQETKITGTIVDAAGIPIMGATVLIMEQGSSTSKGSISDENGKFNLTVTITENTVIKFQMLGFVSQQLNVQGHTDFNITLVEDLLALEEVVITGYQTIKRERATGSYGIATEKTLDRQVTTNVTDKLKGAIPGVLVKNDNSFEIRGISTLTANNQPLFVIDGVPVETNLDNINPEDIKQITVLKDAASTAIYGAKSSNGVVVITTKNGSSGDMKVNYSVFSSFSSKRNLNDYQAASSSTNVDAEIWGVDIISDIKPWTPTNFIGYTRAQEIYTNPNISEEERTTQLNLLRAYDQTNEFSDLFIRSELSLNYNASISGGTEKANYYFSAGYVDTQSGYVGDQDDRLTLSLRNEYKLGKKFTVGINMYSTFTNNKNNSIEEKYLKRKSYDPIVDENGERVREYNELYASEGWKDYKKSLGVGYLDWKYNVLDDQESRDNTTDGINFRINALLKYQIIDALSFSTSFYKEIDRRDNRNFHSEDSYFTRNLVNRGIYDRAIPGLPQYDLHTQAVPYGGILFENNYKTDSYTWRNQFDYSQIFGMHAITAIAGTEVREVQTNNAYTKKYGYDENTFLYTPVVPAELATLIAASNGLFYSSSGTSANDYQDTYLDQLSRDFSYYGNASYTYNNKYSVTGSIRLDQSNSFGLEKRLRSQPLWSVGALWNADKEDFIPEVFDRLQLKASYGFTGNVDKNVNSFVTATATTGNLGNPYYQLNSPENYNFSFETSKIYNLSLNFGLFDIVNGSFEYYHKNNDDLLGPQQIDYSVGWTTAYSNYASTTGNGFEIALNVDVIKSNDVNWNVGFNYSNAKTNITNVDTPYQYASNFINKFSSTAYIEGNPIGSIYAYQNAGLDENGHRLLYNAAGDVIPVAEAGTLLADDIAYVGQVSPTYYGGITTNLSYKDFTLDLLFTYKGGHVSRMPELNYLNAMTVGANTHNSISNRWMEPGDENTAGLLPVLEVYRTNLLEDRNLLTDDRVFDADYFKFQKVTLTYDFNVPIAGKKQSIQIYGEARNIATWAKNDLGLDPDFVNPYSGAIRLTDPFTFTFGLRGTF